MDNGQARLQCLLGRILSGAATATCLEVSRLGVSCDPRARLHYVPYRLDYCNVLLAGALKATTNKLQHLLNAAARLLSGMRKFDRVLPDIVHVELHWLDVLERVTYKLVMMVHNCLHVKAPRYFFCCRPGCLELSV